MTQPEDLPPHVHEGTDVQVDVDRLDDADTPATSDPDEMTDDGGLGGTAGQGGAG